eukprot:TRINITY_DN31053_c0_g1_i1.p1 TRINITY_DN31053_c0_g1~~TRINITY_DN31053_c0_g1_i1.p1  ORF type:complete len:1315 (-),score=264.06 TRINITY_DN31053_c0_g1_i1:368-4312(-)
MRRSDTPIPRNGPMVRSANKKRLSDAWQEFDKILDNKTVDKHAPPVLLLCDNSDPCSRELQIRSKDQTGLLFKLCELLDSHGVDITSLEINSEDGIVQNVFGIHTARPSDFGDAIDWCQELEDFLIRSSNSGSDTLDVGSLFSVSKRLSVNPDLLSVVSFDEIPRDEAQAPLPPIGYRRYRLELGGINQAGLLTYSSYVLFRCGFDVKKGRISTVDGHISDLFEIWTKSSEAEHMLRQQLDMPGQQKESNYLPFHVTPSDGDLVGLLENWRKAANSAFKEKLEASQEQWKLSMMESPVFSPPAFSPLTSLNASAGRRNSFPEAEEDQGPGLRSRVLSTLSDNEQPSCSPAVQAKDGPASTDLATVAASASPSQHRFVNLGQLSGASQPPERPRSASQVEPTRMSIKFNNGDVYKGHCVNFPDGGEKRHGHGVYTYSSGTHESYREYRGQWREDKKHGYGVLFYRNGGVYVGQWEDNQKHGLGVLLENQADAEPTAMPSFRYEGEWYEDAQHGLGVEECDSRHSYFGHFANGKRSGRGVVMKFTKQGIMGCEAMDMQEHGPSGPSNPPRLVQTSVPLLDALEGEMGRFDGELAASSKRRGMLDLGRSGALDDSAATYHCGATTAHATLASLCFGEDEDAAAPVGGGDNKPSMSMRQSRADTAPLRSLEPAGEHDTGRTQSPSTMTGPTFARANGSYSSGSVDNDKATPLVNVHSHMMNGGFGNSLDAASSSSPKFEPAVPSPSPGTRGRPSEDDDFVFELSEANNFLSPSDTKQDLAKLAELLPKRLDRVNSEEAALADKPGTQNFQLQPTTKESRGPALSRRPASSRSVSPGNRRTVVSLSGDDQRDQQFVRLDSEEGGFGRASSLNSDPGRKASLSRRNRPLDRPMMSPRGSTAQGKLSPLQQPERERQPRRAIRSPMLWSEEELAAFLVCVGIDPMVCRKVLKRKLKGVVHFLELSNSELRRDFGLTKPVDRLTARQALKRLLDADRWENSIRGHKVGDVLNDSVLSKFIVPLEELTLVARISQGGYGTVYRGILEPSVTRGGLQPGRSHLVAVKEMKGERRVRLYELLKEACVMASLRHPNICMFLGVCADVSARKDYIISELMDCSLFDLLHQPFKLRWHGDMSVDTVIKLFNGIVNGVVYLHAKNIVHADLKSSNVLIDYTTSRQLTPRICDFGHAAVRSHPAPHHRCGTPHWAAPEVLRSEALGTAADIYSIGVILWEMLTQKLPHKGLSFSQVLASVGWAGWTPDPGVLPPIPDDLRRLNQACLNFTPRDRPSGREVQRRLRQIPKQARVEALRALASFMGGCGPEC